MSSGKTDSPVAQYVEVPWIADLSLVYDLREVSREVIYPLCISYSRSSACFRKEFS